MNEMHKNIEIQWRNPRFSKAIQQARFEASDRVKIDKAFHSPKPEIF